MPQAQYNKPKASYYEIYFVGGNYVSSLFTCFACLRALRAVLGTGLHTFCYALSVKSSSDDVITHTGEILNTSAADQNNAVFLQVMANAGYIGADFNTV